MRISELYRDGRPGVSIEIFPPKSADADDALRAALDQLVTYQPAFISCTYGAGGTTRNRTVEWCCEIQSRYQVPATAHFTCVGHTRDELLEWLRAADQQGIQNIMALRGDAPAGETEFRAAEGGFRNANQLVSLIREHFPQMGIGVAGYPEKHPEACDPATDLENLKRKVDAGADAVYTQLFFENQNFFRFRDCYTQAGLSVPLVPGIMPITEFARIKRIVGLCGAYFPPELSSKLEAAQDDKQAQFEIGVEHATRQCRELIEQGAPGLHLYVLNRSQACERIFDNLGLASAPSAS